MLTSYKQWVRDETATETATEASTVAGGLSPEDQAERRREGCFHNANTCLHLIRSCTICGYLRPTGYRPEVLLSFLDPVTSRDYREVTREPFTETASASILLIEGSSGGGLPGACDLRVGRRFLFFNC